MIWTNVYEKKKSIRKTIWTNSDQRRWEIRSLWWHENQFEVNWPPEPTLVLHWISKFFLFGALPSDTLKIKHTKNLKEIPSRDALENLPGKASMYAFIHLKLIGNLQGYCQYIMADMLNLSISIYSDIRRKNLGSLQAQNFAISKII